MAYDWLLIKNEFIQGYTDDKGDRICPTIKELSIRHGCSYSTIRKKSASENWQQERNIYSTKRNKKILDKKEEILIIEASSFDNKSLQVADKGVSIGLSRLSDKDLSNHDLMKLSTALSNFQKIGKLALGEPTEHTITDGKQTHEVNLHDRIKDYTKRFDTNTIPEGSDSSDNI